MNREKKGSQSHGENLKSQGSEASRRASLDESTQICLDCRGLPLNRKRKATVSGGMMEWRAFADQSEIGLFLWLYVSLEV